MDRNLQDKITDWTSWPLDREVVISRVVNADRETAFRAWVDPAQIVKWFGPEGFVIESRNIDIRAGGDWQFDMVAPDGTRFPNRMDFLRIEPPKLIEIDYGTGDDNDPNRFRMLVTFDAQSDRKTVVTLRQLHPSAERRAIVIGFGAVEYGAQTLNKLARHVAALSGEAGGGR
ncbi:SRPBCC family protein [Paracoccus sp. S1E-3]|uniref:SRPBCC family protein n=1 Tax=Paracoccus sp. S1E-3 TaxID=2756130 RepID=UPI0015EE3CC4|nr:SRPBCC family protein [Paracoccus sp. S1E-3]MBA4492606.1 SRPBCC domain-containing protein [Paracoccus sp. S1E-3]